MITIEVNNQKEIEHIDYDDINDLNILSEMGILRRLV